MKGIRTLAPTAKNLWKYFGGEQGFQARGIITKAPKRKRTGPRPLERGDVPLNDFATALRVGPSRVEATKLLELFNEAVGGDGIEVIRGHYWDSWYGDNVLEYVNLGDTYSITLLYDPKKRKFEIGSWGEWVENFGDERGVS